MSNHHLRDKKLSYKAKGLPETTPVSLNYLINIITKTVRR